MQVSIYFIIIIFFLFSCTGVFGASCEVYDIRNNAFCLSRVRYPVHLEDGMTQNMLGTILYNALNLSHPDYGLAQESLGEVVVLSSSCVSALISYSCTLFIPGTFKIQLL